MKTSLCNCIALYDYTPDRCNLKGWFNYMDQWAEEIGIPWESIGSNFSLKLMQFKNGKKKYEKINFGGIDILSLIGGMNAPGTNENWKIKTCFNLGKNANLHLCFPEAQKSFTKENLTSFLKNLLHFGDFKYGICYQRPYNLGPAAYASGTFEGLDLLTEEESDRIWFWSKKYVLNPHYYRTGLLRDVYSFNILIDVHLREKVGTQTFQQWIESDSSHGTLDKLTDSHWLWSIEPEHISVAQESLQEAGLLLCYKV